jgi:hypothetical protein
VAVPSEDVSLVIENELALLTPGVRSSEDTLRKLLAPDFTEIGASGRLWTREEMISGLIADASAHEVIIDHSEVTGRVVGDDLVLLSYVTSSVGRRARRSSLWRRREGTWELVHHQGTPMP